MPFQRVKTMDPLRRLPLGFAEREPDSWGRIAWWARRDLNPHTFRYWILNPARLPIPPLAHSDHELDRSATSRSLRAKKMVGREGIEPPTLGLRVPCSTS